MPSLELSKTKKSVRYVCTIAYNGTKFHGWAIQPNVNSVQGTLQKSLGLMFQHPISIVASGRTDAGVHALGQVFHFDTKLEVACTNVKRFLNNWGRGDWLILKVKKVPKTFHARYSVVSKTYLYKIAINHILDPLRFDYTWQYLHPLPLKKMREVAAVFIGTHNFLSFATVGHDQTKREIKSIKISKQGTDILIRVKGKGFLRSMVRMLVATMVNFANGKINIDKCYDLLNHPVKGKAIDKAPAGGLYLLKVAY